RTRCGRLPSRCASRTPGRTGFPVPLSIAPTSRATTCSPNLRYGRGTSRAGAAANWKRIMARTSPPRSNSRPCSSNSSSVGPPSTDEDDDALARGLMNSGNHPPTDDHAGATVMAPESGSMPTDGFNDGEARCLPEEELARPRRDVAGVECQERYAGSEERGGSGADFLSLDAVPFLPQVAV